MIDLETGDGYRRYLAPDFKSGLKLLLEHVDDLRKALVVRDLARTPKTPGRLMKLLVHLHEHKQLVAGFSFKADFRNNYVDTPGLGELVVKRKLHPLIPRPSTVLLFFPGDVRVGIETDDRDSPGPTVFSYRRAQPRIIVYSEGMAVPGLPEGLLD